MSKKKPNKQAHTRSNLEIYQSIRREWEVNPVTKIIPDKRKKKPKYKKIEED